MNIKIAKAFRTTSSEALCILAGTTPIIIKTEEVFKQYNVKKGIGCQTLLIDTELELKSWPNHAEAVKNHRSWGIPETNNSGIHRREQERVRVWIWSCNIRWKGTSSTTKIQTWQHMFQQSDGTTSYSQGAWSNRINRNHGKQLTSATIFTGSRISTDSLKNANNHSYLFEESRKKISNLERANWTIEFSWFKAHVGIYGNELADRLAKDDARSSDNTIACNTIPLSTLHREIEEEATEKWPKEWDDCKKAAATKQFFQNVTDRQKLWIDITPDFTALVTGHGKTRAFLHRFKILDQATCVCKKGDQTTDHLINQCTPLQIQRDHLKSNVLKRADWPESHKQLIKKHLKPFLTFRKTIELWSAIIG